MDDGDGDHILRANAKDANGLDCVVGPHCDRREGREKAVGQKASSNTRG